MNKNIAILFLVAALFVTNTYWVVTTGSSHLDDHAVGQINLEIRQRDVVIEELSSVILHQNKERTLNEMESILKTHPKTRKYPPFYEVHDNFIEFGTTLKFEFQNGNLSKVYW